MYILVDNFCKFMDFPMYSLYEWKKMNEELLSEFCATAQNIFKDVILVQDLCYSIEKSCSPKCTHHFAKDELELKFSGVNALFKLGEVIDLNHQEQLEDLTYHIIETTRTLNYTLEERAKFICDAWQEKVLLLK